MELNTEKPFIENLIAVKPQFYIVMKVENYLNNLAR